MDRVLPALEIEPPAPADACVIWLHGLGANGYDFQPVVQALSLSTVRFVLPHAPERAVTLNGGYVMPAWYDITDPDLRLGEDALGIRVSQDQVEALIEREKGRGIPEARIVLAGFSQGGAIALHTGLRHPESLAGILALSTYLPLASSAAAEASPANGHIPVFMAHGSFDPIIPLPHALASRDQLVALGCAITWREYPMAHTVTAQEITDIGDWLKHRLGL
ncbi:MAG: alpha/beta hydrolase [Betaproteobacteria bacterium]|nr:alpha/beta hydrolase [Betaproteobacteria bacterium]